MEDLKVFRVPSGFDRALGRDTARTLKNWGTLVSEISTAPHIMRGVPEESPYIRRFHHQSFLSQRQRGFCFPAGTLVLLEDGTEKSIEEIVIGDRVITHLGRSRSVVNTFERTYSGTMTTIAVKGWQYPLTMTENHHVFVVKNAVTTSRSKYGHYRPGDVVKLEANQLRPKDYIIMSRGVPSGMEDIRIDVRDYVKGCITTEDGSRCRRVNGTHQIKWDILIDEKFAKLVGLYLAEGGTDNWDRDNPSRVKLSFNRKELDLMEFTVDSIRDIFGVEAKIVHPEDKETRSWVVCNSTVLGMFFKVLCGRNLYNKTVPSVFFRAKPNIKRELIRGWLEGDGHSRPVGVDNQGVRRSIELSGVTISKTLHRTLFRLAASIGAKGSARVSGQKDRTKKRRDLCFYSQDAIAIYPELRDQAEDAGIPLDGARNHHSHELGYLCKIDKIELTDVEEIPVYNFEVEEDHSYVANGVAVANCVGFNTANSIMTLLRIPLGATANIGTPLPLRQISPLYVYDISRMVASNEGIRLGNGDGGIGSCAIKACHKWGAVELDEYDSSPQAIDQHRNGTVPSSDVVKTGTEHPVNEFSICDSFSHGLEMLGSGFPITLCSQIPEGMMHTDAKGFFRMIGNVIGGHCYSCVDYSKKLNLAWISQAWEGWGEKTTDPTFTPMHGYTQIGTCPLDELERYFDQRKISSGSSEIYVANSVEGWTPKIVDYGPM